MRYWLVAILFIAWPKVTLAGGELRWPDAEIPVPPLVDDFIVSECLDYAGTTEERTSMAASRVKGLAIAQP